MESQSQLEREQNARRLLLELQQNRQREQNRERQRRYRDGQRNNPGQLRVNKRGVNGVQNNSSASNTRHINRAHQYFQQLPDSVCVFCQATLYPEETKKNPQGNTICKTSCYLPSNTDRQQYEATSIPLVITQLTAYEQKFLSPIRLFSTINTTNEVLFNRRGYFHLEGTIGARINQGNMRFWGMLGGVETPPDFGSDIRPTELQNAFRWLFICNPLFAGMTNAQMR